MKKFFRKLKKPAVRKKIFAFFMIFGLMTPLFSSLPVGVREVRAAPVTVILNFNQTILTEGTTWTVPDDWTDNDNTIEVIGGGGAGFSDTANTAGAAGGGGGGYSKSVNVDLTPGSTVTYSIGQGGKIGAVNGGDTYFCKSTSNCANISDLDVRVGAKGGTGATSASANGVGGASGDGQAFNSETKNGADTQKYSGGDGADGHTNSDSGGGGGGAAGPNGNGGAGGPGDTDNATDGVGGGGGGGGGGSAGGSGITSDTVRAAGGNNYAGTGGGTGGGTGDGSNGSNGGGGSGGSDANDGGHGGNGIEWTVVGSGGGGGGVGDMGVLAGGNGGLFGAGGGGGVIGGRGAPGLIVITYNGNTPTNSVWTVPEDWNDSNNTIEVIGGGGSAYSAANSGGSAGGGGGGYKKTTNVDLTPGNDITYSIGQGGRKTTVGLGAAGVNGGDTWICNSTSNCASITGTAVVAGAKGGTAGTNATTGGRTGGQASAAEPDTSNAQNGGTGGAGNGTGDSGGGGGGAGQLTEAGQAGGGSASTGAWGGGGGGGAGDTSGTDSTAGSTATSATGGAGGAGRAGTGDSAGTGGGGDGGNNGASGVDGYTGDEWISAGAGGGGGGEGDNTSAEIRGGDGGLFGGGGGGGKQNGFGANGIIVITYEPIVVSPPTVTTQEESSLTDTTATLNGNITATGGASVTTRGFAYGTDATLSTVIATTTENGTFSTGAFTGNVSSLTCNTIYYTRPYAINSAGTGLGTIDSFTTSACPTTTIGDGSDQSDSTIAPSASATEVGRFSLVTNTGTDTVTGMTATLAPANAYTNIATVDVQTIAGVSQCSLTPVSNTVLLTGCAIGVTTGETQYKIMLTPKTHANMAAPAIGVSYDITATVTSITATNTTAGSDTDSATVTVDNLSPNNVTSATATAGDGEVTLEWTNPGDADLHRVMVLASTSAITFTPVEGDTYSVSTLNGDSRVACYGLQTSCTDSSVSNGTVYYYKIFTKDSRNNWSDSGVTPTGSPATPQNLELSVDHFRFIRDNGTQGSASYLASENTGVTEGVDVGDRIRLRLSVANTGGLSAEDFNYLLEYSSGACSTWSPVAEASANPSAGDWLMDVNSYYADGGESLNDAGLSDPALGGGASSFYRPITIDHTKIGASDITNFPLLVSGTYAYLATEANGGKVKNANGYDIEFYADESLTIKLDWETQKYIATTGEVVYWVEVPAVSHTVDTTIYMAYGDDSITTDQSNESGTWRSSFKRVFHLDDGTSLHVDDSTSHEADGTNSGATATSLQVNGGANFVAGSSQSFNAPQDGEMAIATGPFSIRFWFDTSATSLGRIMSWYDGTHSLQITRPAGSQQGILLAIRAGAGDSGSKVDSSGRGYSGINRYIFTHDGSQNYKLYKDGADVTQVGYGNSDITAFTGNSSTMYFGQRGNGSYLSGKLDEIWIENTNITASEALAEYNNQDSPATFYSVGSEEEMTSGVFVPGFVMSEESLTPDLTLASQAFTELEYSIRSSAAANVGDPYCFRLTNNGDENDFVYGVTPAITLTRRHSSGGGGVSGGVLEEVFSPDPERGNGNQGGDGDDSIEEEPPEDPPEVEGGDQGGGGGEDLGYLFRVREGRFLLYSFNIW